MAINEVPVGLDKIYFISAAEEVQTQTNRETGEVSNRLNYEGDAYVLDVQISAHVVERGLPALASQAIQVEVPIENWEAEVKRIRSIPQMTEVKLDSLTVRSGVSQKGALYSMWTGKGLQPVKSTPPAPAAAQRQG